MEFKAKRMEPEKQVVFALLAMAACVLVLTLVTVWFSNNGIKPEEQAVSASVELKNYVFLLQDGTIDPRIVVRTFDQQIDVREFRELEEKVKAATLRTYTDLIVWEATFVYKMKDGTTQERRYTKTGQNKGVDAFLQKYYKKVEEKTDDQESGFPEGQ